MSETELGDDVTAGTDLHAVPDEAAVARARAAHPSAPRPAASPCAVTEGGHMDPCRCTPLNRAHPETW